MEKWAEQRLTYLPSEKSPERWLLEWCERNTEKVTLAEWWGVDNVTVVEEALEQARRARAHEEFFTLGRVMQLPEERVRGDVIQFLRLSETNALQDIEKCIRSLFAELN